MTRFVFDINALISAFLIEGSVPRQALRSALNQGVVLVSVPLVTTLAGVFRRPKFDRYLTLHEREELVAAFVANSRMVDVTERIRACRDPGSARRTCRPLYAYDDGNVPGYRGVEVAAARSSRPPIRKRFPW